MQGESALVEYQLIQAMLADSAVEIAANRALVHQVAWEFTRGADRKTLHAKAAMVKLSASEAAGRVVDRAVQIFGGPRLPARLPGRAALPRAAGRSHQGGHLRGAAPGHRQRAQEARDRRPARDAGLERDAAVNDTAGSVVVRREGPVAVVTIEAIADSLYDEVKEPLYTALPLLARMVDAGLLGKKSGRGFYLY